MTITASSEPRTLSAGGEDEVRFQDSADIVNEAVESLNTRKPRTFSPRKLIQEFEKVVNETLKELPEEYSKEVDNVGIVVEGWPGREDYQTAELKPNSLLFGLYKGVPKTKRGNNYSAVLPDKIKIFAGPILMVSRSLEDLKKIIKKTVLHELGHYFGLSDDQIYKAQGI